MSKAKTKKRVVAYARVSTDKKDQKNSLENQTTYFQRELERNTDCQFVKINHKSICDNGVYHDRGFSGTKLKRPAFDKMLEDAGLQAIIDADSETKTTKYKVIAEPKFDIIYIKDTSRFARNIVAIDVLRTLKENNVFVRFLDIGKTTENDADMTYIGIFLQFAEQESTDRSRKVHFGYAESIRQGKIYTGGRKLIGYDLDEKTNCLIINEKEAELVRLVFDLYTEEGLGQQLICNKLAELGYFNLKGNKYTRSTIKRMLCNEKYKGESNSGRYEYKGYSGLFTHQPKTMRNYDDELRQQARDAQKKLLEQGIVKIPAIISEEQFEKAQHITDSNRKAYNNNCTYHGITDYAKKIKCGCGGWYTAQSRKYSKGSKSFIRYYACQHRFAYDEYNNVPKCDNPSIREDKLDTFLSSENYYNLKLQSIISLLEMGEFAKRRLVESIDTDNASAVLQLEKEIQELSTKRSRLLVLYADGQFEKAELDTLTSQLTTQIAELTEKKNHLSKGNDALENDIAELERLISTAKKERAEIQKIIDTEDWKKQSRRYPTADRKKILKDVEYITVDKAGKPHITFKSIASMQTASLYLGQLTEYINDLEEQGWEQELEELEKSKKAH